MIKEDEVSRLSLAANANAAPTILRPVSTVPIFWLNTALISNIPITAAMALKIAEEYDELVITFYLLQSFAFCSRMSAMKSIRLVRNQVK